MVYFIKRCNQMTNSFSFQNLMLNQTVFPTKLLTSYNELGLDERDVIVILQIHRYLQSDNEFPTPAQIANHLTISEGECVQILRKLIQKRLLKIDELHNEKNQLSEAYNLNPLLEKLLSNKSDEAEANEGSIFILFHHDFVRPLSAFEVVTIIARLVDDK